MLLLLALILAVLWAIGFFVLGLGVLIHLLLLFAVVSVLINIIRTNSNTGKK